MKQIFILFFFFIPIFLFGKINVTVSILPQKYFVQKIAGNLANVVVMVRPGSEPASYEPKPKQLSHLLKSQIYFSIGVPYERVWLKRFKNINPKLIFINTGKNIKKIPMLESYSFGLKIKKRLKIKVSDLDPHIWLSPLLVKKIVLNIEKAFVKIDPKHAKIYKKNLVMFDKNIEALHNYGILKLKNLRHRKFIVFHPVWGYFAKEFNLKQIPIQLEGKNPSLLTLTKMINYAKESKIKVIFVQPEFSKKSAEVIASSIKGKVIVLDPLELNWEAGIKKAINTFSKVLKNE